MIVKESWGCKNLNLTLMHHFIDLMEGNYSDPKSDFVHRMEKN